MSNNPLVSVFPTEPVNVLIALFAAFSKADFLEDDFFPNKEFTKSFPASLVNVLAALVAARSTTDFLLAAFFFAFSCSAASYPAASSASSCATTSSNTSYEV